MNLQNHYDFEREIATNAESIDAIEPLAIEA
jgi:hypothetical protein